MAIDYGSNNVTTSGNITVSGVVTATSGSFTNLLINGSSFNSSVSGLLPTITNSGDNRIITSDGTTTGLNAESNLVFNGTNLGIGTTSPSGQLHVVGTGIFSQRVGINTGSPSTALHVVGTGNITTINSVPTFLAATALTTNTNNWNPGYGDVIRVSGTTSGINITGLTAPSALGDNYVRIIINIGSTHNLTLNHQSTSSTSGNRFITPTAGDHIIPPTGTVSILYDTVDTRWRIL